MTVKRIELKHLTKTCTVCGKTLQGPCGAWVLICEVAKHIVYACDTTECSTTARVEHQLAYDIDA